jgi:hypothetical protein
LSPTHSIRNNIDKCLPSSIKTFRTSQASMAAIQISPTHHNPYTVNGRSIRTRYTSAWWGSWYSRCIGSSAATPPKQWAGSMSSRVSRWSSYRVAGSGWLQAALSLELSKEHLVKGTDLKTELLRRCVPRKSLG